MKTAVKTFIFVFLSIVMLAACGSEESEVFDVDYSFKAETTDLEGVTIRYLRETGGQGIHYTGSEQVLGYEIGTVLGDLAMQRIKDVESSLNCKFDIKYFSDTGSGYADYNNFRMNNSIGEYYCDIFCGVSDRFREDMKTGALMGLSELEDYIDYRNEEKWGRRNILEVLYWEDDVYGLIPMSWPASSVSYQGLTVINEDLISAVNAADPRDLYENGQWTWQTLRDYLEQYHVQEGNEVKQYAVTFQYRGDVGMVYILSNGFRLAEKGPDGNYRSGLHDPKAMTAMNEALDIVNGPLSYTVSINENHLDALKNGTTVLGVLHQAEYLENLAREMTNFGVITWPSGPDVDPGFITASHFNLERAIVISRFSPNVESAAIALNALYEPFEEYPTT
jgi:ABC-type glycerol-3-phosphate transport system substrate-binding protein